MNPLTWKDLQQWGYGAHSIILSSFGIESAPVPVEEIAHALGVQLFYGTLDEKIVTYGHFRRGKAILVVSPKFSEGQRRLSIAAQLGILSAGDFDGITRLPEYSDRLERSPPFEFAGNLLMPSWLIDEYDNGGSVASYARRFKVPADMARRRLLEYHSGYSSERR